MDLRAFDPNFLSGHDFSRLSGLSAGQRESLCEDSGGGSSLSQSQSLVLDSKRGELVKIVAKKVAPTPEAKTAAALKNHSEAEKRRRDRINGHLATLRGLVPCKEKMDKAALLAQVINEVKELKKKALEASRGLLIPMDADEVRVEPHHSEKGDGEFYFRASLCCDYRPELLSELRQALDALQLDMVRAEISTLDCRVKNVFVFSGCLEAKGNKQELVSSVLRALRSVLEKGSGLEVFSPRAAVPNKRCRFSCFDSSSSSS